MTMRAAIGANGNVRRRASIEDVRRLRMDPSMPLRAVHPRVHGGGGPPGLLSGAGDGCDGQQDQLTPPGSGRGRSRSVTRASTGTRHDVLGRIGVRADTRVPHMEADRTGAGANRRPGGAVYPMEGDTMAGGVGVAAMVPRVVPDDERALVIRVQRGEQEAFNELAQRYARRAFAIAYRILRHTQDAEDLVQDAFIAALDGLASFDASRPFAPWFFRIVVNRSLNAVSARSTRDRHVTVYQLWSDDVAVDYDPAESSEIRTRFQAALGALPKHQRLIVELSDIDGRSSTEIGEMMDLPRGTVRWHLHQARKTLRVALALLLERSA